MALDASIYGRFQPKSAASYAAEFEQLAGMREQRQDNALARAFRQEQMGQARAQAERGNALRALQQGLPGRSEAERVQAMRDAGFADEAAQYEEGMLKRDLTRADIGVKQATAKKSGADAAKTELETMDAALAQFNSLLPRITDPRAGAQWVQAQYQDPRVGPKISGLMPLEDALDRIPQDPQQFAQWRDEQAMGIAKYREMLAAQARDSEAARRNQATEALTRRGQDVGAATTRRGQDMADRRAGMTMEAEAGGPGQMELVRQFGRPPKDHRWKPDGSAEPIPGGPADIKAGAEGEKRQQRREALSASARGVLDTISDAKKLVGITTTGVGGLLRNIPATDARNLSAKLETIKANLGFDRLQQMRDMSPTGGALGAVAVQELTALQSTVASLDQLQEDTELLSALDKIEGHYNRWLRTVEGSAQSPQAMPSMPSPDAIAAELARRRGQ
jgi:hypothetical protein